MAEKLLWIVTSDKNSPPTRTDLAELYLRVGGQESLRLILRDFYQAMSHDILIGFFFTGKDLNLIAETQMSFLMRAMGAAASCSGLPPAKAHLKLAPILSGHFDRRLRILEQILQAHGVSTEDIRSWIAFENAFREGIVQKS